jgi:hypothetical protein
VNQLKFGIRFVWVLALSLQACESRVPAEEGAREKAKKLTDELMDDLEAQADSTLQSKGDTVFD